MKVKRIDIAEPYTTEIYGLGEVYEIMSVNRLRRNLRRKYGVGTLMVASNADHGGGMTEEELAETALRDGGEIISRGFTDTFIIRSAPRTAGTVRRYWQWPCIVPAAKVLFWFLLWLEPLLEGRTRSHMRYVLVKKETP